MINKKEIIYRAVIDLLKNKTSLNNIKISDIAEYANIGKGTVYEYFKSKDDIINETVIYIIEENTNKIKTMIDMNQEFKSLLINHIKTLTEIILENSIFHTLLLSGEMSNLFYQDFEYKIMKKIMETKNRYYRLLGAIINKGVEENKFQAVTDPFIINSIGNTIFTSIMYCIHECENEIKLDDFISKIYSLILKMLS